MIGTLLGTFPADLLLILAGLAFVIAVYSLKAFSWFVLAAILILIGIYEPQENTPKIPLAISDTKK